MKITKKPNKTRAFIVTSELALISSITVLGLASGLTAVRDAVVGELTDLSQTISSIDQSVSFTGLGSDKATTSGSEFVDEMERRVGNVVVPPRGSR